MSGVLVNGIQWERCNQCGGWERIERLGYEKPSKAHPVGRDLCRRCARYRLLILSSITVSQYNQVH